MILFCGKQYNDAGGMETHALYFSRYFMKTGALKIIVFRHPVPAVIYIESNEKIEFLSTEELLCHLKGRRENVIFFNDGHWIEDMANIRSHFPDSLMIMRSGGNEFMKAPWKENCLDLAERQRLWAHTINRELDFILANSAYSVNRMRHNGISEGKILLMRGGVDLDQCRINIENKSAWRRQFDRRYGTCGAVLFCIASRFVKFKGIIETIKCFRSLGENLKWHLVLVGDGPEKDDIVSFCRRYLPERSVTFLGKLDQLTTMRVIAISDYLLNLSTEFAKISGSGSYIHTETMGRSMLEAVCQFVPIIASDAGGTKELFFEHRHIGFLVETKSGACSKIIEKCIEQVYRPDRAARFDSYGWEYLFEKLYSRLFEVNYPQKGRRALCADIDGTIVHRFFKAEERRMIFKDILSLSGVCELIFNTAGEYADIEDRYPEISAALDRVIIISNCGKRIIVHGQEDLFWQQYTDSIAGADRCFIERIARILEEQGAQILKIDVIDKLYVNFKVSGCCEDMISMLNRELYNTEFCVRGNKSNIKLISKRVNKGTAVRYLKNVMGPDRVIGAGNNVLDYDFLDACDIAYIVNGSCRDYVGIAVEDYQSMAVFMKEIRKRVSGRLL